MEATEEVLREIPALVSECVDAVNGNDYFRLQHLQRQVHVVADMLEVLTSQLAAVRLQGQGSSVISSVRSLRRIVHDCKERIQLALDSENASISGQEVVLTGAISTGQQGRPKVDIGREQLESLQELGFTWTAIAKMFGVSVHTLLRRRKEYGMPVGQDCYSRISDDILDDAISKIL